MINQHVSHCRKDDATKQGQEEVLPWCIACLTVIEAYDRSAELKVDFFRGHPSHELSLLIFTTRLRVMLEGKAYSTFEMGFLFVAGLNDHATGLLGKAGVTRLHSFLSDLASSFT